MAEERNKYAMNIKGYMKDNSGMQRKMLRWTGHIHIKCSKFNTLNGHFPLKFSQNMAALDSLKADRIRGDEEKKWVRSRRFI
jgi:hypothetical protein